MEPVNAANLTLTTYTQQLISPRNTKTAMDWVRDMRFNPEVNKVTVGTHTDRVTPLLLLNTSIGLLNISRGKLLPSAKDSLAFQRFYGPALFFALHIQRDGGKLARGLLWKATNKGSVLGFGSNTLLPHISSVFYDSNLAQYIDGSTAFLAIDATFKTTRVGLGGIASTDNAPDLMRAVQPSYFGYVDAIRSPLRGGVGLSGYLTKNVLKGSDGKLYQRFINARTGKLLLVDSVTAASSIVASHEVMQQNTKSVFALGGRTGVRIVDRDQVDYYLPRPDDAYSTGSNMVTMYDCIKEMRLLMGCLHPDTPMLWQDSLGFIQCTQAYKVAGVNGSSIMGCTDQGAAVMWPMRNAVVRLPIGQKHFYKVVLASGRVLITSPQHRWAIVNDNTVKLVLSTKLKKGMIVPRTLFYDVPCRHGLVMGRVLDIDLAVLLGRLQRSVHFSKLNVRFTLVALQKLQLKAALSSLGIHSVRVNKRGLYLCMSISDPNFIKWVLDNVGTLRKLRKVPSCILSAGIKLVAAFLDSFAKLVDNVGMDYNGDVWLMDIDNLLVRCCLSFMFSRLYTDTIFRDIPTADSTMLAIKLIPVTARFGNCTLDRVVDIVKVKSPGVMIDFDVNDNLYSCGNGVITHNSKYATQAVPLILRLLPLVQSLDRASGKTMLYLIGKKLGTKWADKPGVVTAVRRDRIDVAYDDGTTGAVLLYRHFPSNIKGFLHNKPLVKAGQRFAQGDLLASSNFTDDKGVLAMGRNLRVGYISYRGGTYEDAVVLSLSAAKKMSSLVMYKKAVDLDKTIKTGKNIYTMWKPNLYKDTQLLNIDDLGVVRPGAVLKPGDPMVLAVQVTLPSPGTLGKRILTDKSLTWLHQHPGVVTDVVKTNKGIKVYATSIAPVLIGDKLSGRYGNKGTCTLILPDLQMPRDAKGRPLLILMSPLGIVSRCYDKLTLFLTNRGWIKGADIMRLDKLYCYNPNTGKGSWLKQLLPMYQNKYSGIMLGAVSLQVDFLVTPGHKVWYKTTHIDSPYKLGKILLIYGKRVCLPCIAPLKGSHKARPFKLPPLPANKRTKCLQHSCPIEFQAQDWALFLGWYLSLGSTTYNLQAHLYKVHISQNRHVNPDKCAKIEDMFHRMGMTYWYSRKSARYSVSGKRLAYYCKQFGLCDLKFAPLWIFNQPADIIWRFIDTFTLGDGYRVPKLPLGYSKHIISITSLRLIDDMQKMCCLIGAASSKYSRKVRQGLKPMWNLSITVADKSTRTVGKSLWHMQQYDDMVYCPTVPTGYVLTRRNGKVVCMGNTNPAQLILTQLGKIALKTGKVILVPPFMLGDRILWAKQLSKQYNVPLLLDVYDPMSGRTLKGILTGRQYVYKLKHMALSKMSGRGTATYTALGIPAAGGLLGCFPPWQHILTQHGLMRILDICLKKLKLRVLTFDSATQSWIYNRITDWFIRKADPSQILELRTIIVGNDTSVQCSYPTRNHIMYLDNGTTKCALLLKVGLLLAGIVPHKVISILPYTGSQKLVTVYDITVLHTHNYVLQGGIKVSNSKRFGSLLGIAMIGHGAFDTLVKDAKLIRGQANSLFWRQIRTGQIPTVPGLPLVHKKFFAHLQGSGVNIRKTTLGISVFALTDSDVKLLAGPRLLKSRDTYLAKNFRPIDGGLFGTDIFGLTGDKWGFLQLDLPVLNPVMKQPIARILRISLSQLLNVLLGKLLLDGTTGPTAVKEALLKLDMDRLHTLALNLLKAASKSKKDAALKRYVAIARMHKQGVHPSLYMLTRIPVLPPIFRPISSHSGLTMVADSNYLYAQLLDARNDLRDAQDLPDSFKLRARTNLYKKWNLLVGIYLPLDKKLQSKSVKGLIKWALGDVPKFSAFQRKVFGAIVDTVGRGVVVPNSRLKLNLIGLPLLMAWNIFAPFVSRLLVRAGYPAVEALKMIKERNPQAKEYMLRVMLERPVIMNRAPSLHKLSLMGFNAKLVSGNAIHVPPSIVVPYNMDFDGDSVWNSVKIQVLIEEILENFEKSGKMPLTSIELALYLLYSNQHKENAMIAKDQKIKAASFVTTLLELPRVEGSLVVKSLTVTLWEVRPGYYVTTVNPLTGNVLRARITHVSRHLGLTMYDCTLGVSGAFRTVVTASLDHSLITLNPTTLLLLKTKPMESVGLCVPKTRYSKLNHHSVCTTHIDIHGKRYLSYELGVFLGMMLGDGWVDCQLHVKIACCNPSLQKYITLLLCVLGGLLDMHKTAKLHLYPADPARFSQKLRGVISVYVKPGVALCLGRVIGKGALNKRIPALCLAASQTHMRGLLVGLLATDGSVSYSTGGKKKAATKTVVIHTISPILRDGIQQLCRSLGIRTGVSPYKGVNSVHTCYAVTLSLLDLAREVQKYPEQFTIPMLLKQRALLLIVRDVSTPAKGANSYTIVPFPRGLFCLFSYAQVAKLHKDVVVAARGKGYIRRDVALHIALVMLRIDWSLYKDPSYIKKEDRSGHTPLQAKLLVQRWIDIVRNLDVEWTLVLDVTPSTCTLGWDCTVPGPYTFALADGTIVQDTVNIHVPVSASAVRLVKQRMLPERNLIAMKNRRILYMPLKEYIQGLHIATRQSDKPVQVFNTMALAKAAFRAGTLNVDDPIIIKLQK